MFDRERALEGLYDAFIFSLFVVNISHGALNTVIPAKAGIQDYKT
jgi:hypothetical protein